MGAEIEKQLGIECEYVAGAGGILLARLDGDVVFTNNNSGGVPEAAVVIEAIKAALSQTHVPAVPPRTQYPSA